MGASSCRAALRALPTPAPAPDSGSREPQAGLPSPPACPRRRATLNSWPLLVPGDSSKVVKPAPLFTQRQDGPWLGQSPRQDPVAGLAQGLGWGAWNLLLLCQEEKENNPVYGKGTSADAGQRPPQGQEALCWENRKRGFPGPVGPPAGHPPSFRQFSAASACRQLPVSPSPRLCVPLSRRHRLPVLRQICCHLSPTVRGVSWGLPSLAQCAQVTWRQMPEIPGNAFQQSPARPHLETPDIRRHMWERGSVRSRPVGASVRAASELRPRGTEKASASHMWGKRAGAEGVAKAA